MNWDIELSNKLKDVCEAIDKRQQELEQCNGNVPDESDAASMIETRAVINSDLNRLASQKRQLETAIGRVMEGSFGYCEECDADIPRKRLEMNPATAFCVDCQEAMEKRDKHFVAMAG